MPDLTGFYYITDGIRMVRIIEAERQKVLNFNNSLVSLPAVTFRSGRRQASEDTR